MKWVGMAAVFAAACLAAAGCSRRSEDAGGQGRYITVKGSDTMIQLVSAWAEAFMKVNPGIEVSTTGGGSGTGIAALINGTTDIAAASREIKDDEMKFAAEKAVHPVETTVARDGIAVIVNPQNPVNGLTIEQIRKIYVGQTTNWRQVGGPDEPITVLSRESSSGTYVFFQDHVLGRQDYSPKVRLMPATATIVQSVEDDRWAIGYVGLGYAVEAGGRVKPLEVKANESAPAVTPSEATVRSGEYPIARPLYVYTNGQPTGAVKQFVDFATGSEGQRIVRETGYVPLQ